MWVLAAAGIVVKLFFTRLYNVATSFYLLMGWLPIIVMPHFFDCFGVAGVAWMVAGGLSYSVGTWFLMNDERRRYYHAIWHLLTMLGSACHYFLVLRYIVPGA
jgi:hemolysin III